MGIENVMARLSLSRARVYRLVKDGVLKASKDDAVLMFQEDDVAAAAGELAGRRQRAETLVRIFTARLAEHGIVDLPEVGIADDEAGSKEAVKRLLLDCMAAQASDFYVNPTASGDKLLVRTLGRIHDVARVEGELGDCLKAELKALASLPDDGAGVSSEAIFRHADENHSAQVRLSVVPSHAGEQLHLQFFHAGAAQTLTEIGYTAEQCEALYRLLAGKPGLFVLAGSHYRVVQEHRLALAHCLELQGKLVASIDRSSNYQSESTVHIGGGKAENTDDAEPWQVAMGLCPDVLLLDGVQDSAEVESVAAALSAGITVFVQVQRASIRAALEYLAELGLEQCERSPYFLAASEFIVVPRLCPDCREPRAIASDEVDLLRASAGAQLYRAAGCDKCGGGYRGSRTVWGLLSGDSARDTDMHPRDPLQSKEGSEIPPCDTLLPTALRYAVLAGEVAFEHVSPHLK
ncbi:MAG: hypothetical protein F4X83_04065 [Chloroflexi bacterium]|nr:hypothetical protein [Chloroflexota bacterium]